MDKKFEYSKRSYKRTVGTKNGTSITRTVKVLDEPLYDFQLVTSAQLASGVSYFARGRGANRNIADTNLTSSGNKLPNDQAFNIFGVVFAMQLEGRSPTDVENMLQDAQTLTTLAAITLKINDKEVDTWPAGICGGGYGGMFFADLGNTSDAVGLYTLGDPGHSLGKRLPSGIVIPGGASFSVKVTFSRQLTGSAPTLNADRRLGIIFDGYLEGLAPRL